jgi:anti-anti-sigma regulatory factor
MDFIVLDVTFLSTVNTAVLCVLVTTSQSAVRHGTITVPEDRGEEE